MTIHGAVKSALEQARSAGHVGSSLQSTVDIQIAGEAAVVLEKHLIELAGMFVVSDVRVNEQHVEANEGDGFAFRQEFEVDGVQGHVEVRAPVHAKCPRCWRYLAPKEDELCGRCEDVVQSS